VQSCLLPHQFTVVVGESGLESSLLSRSSALCRGTIPDPGLMACQEMAGDQRACLKIMGGRIKVTRWMLGDHIKGGPAWPGPAPQKGGRPPCGPPIGNLGGPARGAESGGRFPSIQVSRSNKFSIGKIEVSGSPKRSWRVRNLRSYLGGCPAPRPPAPRGGPGRGGPNARAWIEPRTTERSIGCRRRTRRSSRRLRGAQADPSGPNVLRGGPPPARLAERGLDPGDPWSG
jgi:hypothetical protein